MPCNQKCDSVAKALHIIIQKTDGLNVVLNWYVPISEQEWQIIYTLNYYGVSEQTFELSNEMTYLMTTIKSLTEQ